jgi:hypothetical protein
MKYTSVFWRKDSSQSPGRHLEIQRNFPCRVQLSTCPRFDYLKRGDDPLLIRFRIQTTDRAKTSNDPKCDTPSSEYYRTVQPSTSTLRLQQVNKLYSEVFALWDVTQRGLVVVLEQSIGPTCLMSQNSEDLKYTAGKH